MEHLALIGRSFILGVLALFLTRFIAPYTKQAIGLAGRINRLQYTFGIILAFMYLYFLNAFINNLMSSVVILPTYYGVKFIQWIGYLLILPALYSLFVRRLNDLAIPGFIPGILWPLFIIYTYGFTPIKNLDFVYASVIIVINGLLMIAPGTGRANAYGEPSYWPNIGVRKDTQTKR